MMKLELTCPSGFKSAISSGCGSLAGASALADAKFAAQFDEADSIFAGAAPKAAPGSKENRCGTGWRGAEVRSKPPSEPTPEPKPSSSNAGITARGTKDGPSAGMAP